jgi:hypothetical protein
MEPINLRDKRCFSPEALALAQHAFEHTWAEIAPRFEVGRHAEVRNALAVAVMGAVRVDSNTIAPLCEVGLQVMERMYPVEMHMTLEKSAAVGAIAKNIPRRDA